MLKQKGIKSLIFALLLMGFISIFLCIFVNIVHVFQKNNYSASALSGSGTSADPYLITSRADLIAFSSSVSAGTTYQGQFVKLTTDIDFNGADFTAIGTCSTTAQQSISDRSFRGTFLGNNKIVSNFNLVGGYYRNPGKSWGTQLQRTQIIGFFSTISQDAKIYNLCLKNITCSIQQLDFFFVGGIAGMVARPRTANTGCIISNCSVENFTITSSAYAAGILGCGSASIDNCYSGGLSANFDNAIGPAVTNYRFHYHGSSSQGEAASLTISSSGAKIDKCVTNTSLALCFDESKCINSYNSITGDNFLNLSSRSAVGGTGGTIWYYATDYNIGYPKLRASILWDTVNFSVEPAGSAEKAMSIKIPSDALNTYPNTTSPTMVIYTQLVEAHSGYSGYKFIGWTCTDRLNYVAHYEPIEIDVMFTTTNGSAFVTPSAQKFTVSYQSVINISINYETNIFTYTITEKDGNIHEVRYILTEHYESIISDFIINDGFVLESNITISPVASFKNYDIEFE